MYVPISKIVINEFNYIFQSFESVYKVFHFASIFHSVIYFFIHFFFQRRRFFIEAHGPPDTSKIVLYTNSYKKYVINESD